VLEMPSASEGSTKQSSARITSGMSLRAPCEAILRDAGLLHLAWFAGERNDIPDVMRALDCFVLPSLAEGISNTILEAMASGLPVVATAVGATPELVVPGSTGLLVEPGQPQALAAAIAALAGNEKHARTLGRAATGRAQERFSLAAMVRAYDAVYRTLLGQQVRA
jgi:glycosyltransferase involved in cell wall biosynthesis